TGFLAQELREPHVERAVERRDPALLALGQHLIVDMGVGQENVVLELHRAVEGRARPFWRSAAEVVNELSVEIEMDAHGRGRPVPGWRRNAGDDDTGACRQIDGAREPV